jgi:multiple sugar transport system substrate-binding protein
MDMKEEARSPGEHTLSRRDLLRGAAAVGLAGAALSWKEIVASQTVWAKSGPSGTVNFWNLFTGGDGARMIELEKGFRQAYPGVKLNPTTLAWGIPYYTKLTTSTVAGKGPNVAILHLSRLAAYAPKGLLTPLDPAMLAKYGITQDTVSKRAWDMAHYNGKLYAVPLDTHPVVMFYNTKIAKQAGLLKSNGRLKDMSGEKEVFDAILKAQHYTKWGLSMAVSGPGEVFPWRFWYIAYKQLGGDVVTNGGTKVVLNKAHGLRASQFVHDITQKYKVTSPRFDYPAAVATFNSQKAAFFWNGEWEVTTFQKSGIPFDMTVFPNLFGNGQTWADSHGFVIPHASSISQQQLEANLSWIGYALKHSLTWAKGGHIPVYLPVQHSSAYKNLKPESHYAAEAKEIVYEPSAWYSGAASPLQEDAGKAFQSVMTGQSSVSAGYNLFASNVSKLAGQSGGPPGT